MCFPWRAAHFSASEFVQLNRNRSNRTERRVAFYPRALITSNLLVVINHPYGGLYPLQV